MPRNDSTLNVTRNLRNLRPSHELREKFLYNNQMYMVGAHVVTALSGIQFTEFVKDRILRPLRMTQSTYSIDEAIQSGKASETWTSFGRRIPPWMAGVDIELIAGPGGLISNVKELASWVKLYLNDGVDLDTNATIIPRGALETITSAHQIVIGHPTELSATIVGYGLGWARFSLAGHDLLYHNGVLDGVGVVTLANADAKQPALHDIAIHQRPTRIPLLDFTGTYDDAGYGTFTLCNALSRSDECRSVLDDFPTSRFNPTNTTGQYLVDFGSLYPTGYGMNTTPFADLGDGVVRGLGFDWRDGYGSVEESFGVWFSKRV
ncbi:beta-lactamase/transpeptidase-like protein [Lactarius indigo]|nr:beta-lactamase/transpeptidase-like protein [Lactarius indigo]